jgi:hypothetical protein
MTDGEQASTPWSRAKLYLGLGLGEPRAGAQPVAMDWSWRGWVETIGGLVPVFAFLAIVGRADLGVALTIVLGVVALAASLGVRLALHRLFRP